MSGDGRVLAVTSPGCCGEVLSFTQGAVIVYRKNSSGTSWTPFGDRLLSERGFSYGGFNGLALSQDGRTLAARVKETHLQVYQIADDDSAWLPLGGPIGEPESDDPKVGPIALSADGRTVAFGDPAWLSGPFVRIYKWSDSDTDWYSDGRIDWEKRGDEIDEIVALSGDGSTVAVADSSRGYARVYRSTGENPKIGWYEPASTWSKIADDLQGVTSESKGGSLAESSLSLSFDGSMVAVGAPRYDLTFSSDPWFVNDAGRVQVFQLSKDASSWDLIGGQITGSASDKKFGTSVAMTSDGSLVAISSDEAVRLFRRGADNVWIQVGASIGSEDMNDDFGRAFALSYDGSIIITGAQYSDRNTGNGGRARVFGIDIESCDIQEPTGILPDVDVGPSEDGPDDLTFVDMSLAEPVEMSESSGSSAKHVPLALLALQVLVLRMSLFAFV